MHPELLTCAVEFEALPQSQNCMAWFPAKEEQKGRAQQGEKDGWHANIENTRHISVYWLRGVCLP